MVGRKPGGTLADARDEQYDEKRDLLAVVLEQEAAETIERLMGEYELQLAALRENPQGLSEEELAYYEAAIQAQYEADQAQNAARQAARHVRTLGEFERTHFSPTGTARWAGSLTGLTPENEKISGRAAMEINLDSLDGEIEFTGLEYSDLQAQWRDGDLEYTIVMDGNTFTQTGGDSGDLVGTFLGSNHQLMGGVLERRDLSAAFGGSR